MHGLLEGELLLSQKPGSKIKKKILKHVFKQQTLLMYVILRPVPGWFGNVGCPIGYKSCFPIDIFLRKQVAWDTFLNGGEDPFGMYDVILSIRLGGPSFLFFFLMEKLEKFTTPNFQNQMKPLKI